MMNRFAISMENLNDRLKELMGKCGDNELKTPVISLDKITY
jgi:hypothetical protein